MNKYIDTNASTIIDIHTHIDTAIYTHICASFFRYYTRRAAVLWEVLNAGKPESKFGLAALLQQAASFA